MKKGADIESKFYKVLTSEGSNEATIMLYDYIGEYYEYDTEKGWEMGGITDIGFVQELDRLAEKHPVIHLRINSPGGDFFHGNAIMTAIQSCKAEIHTWNDGMAASMAADIWMCGKRRHMAKNALLMIHPAWSICMGNAQAMRECADVTDKVTEAAIIATAASTGISEDDMRSRYYSDYKDHWLTYNDAVKDGLCNETGEEYDAAELTGGVEKMTYKQLLDHFQKSQHPEAPGLMDRLKTIWETTIAKFSNKSALPAEASAKAGQTTYDMTLDELKKSLKEGALKAADVQAYLDELNQEAAPPAADDDSEAAIAELRKDLDAALSANANLATQMKAVEEKLEAYGKLPGASKSAPGLPDGDPPIGEGDNPENALASFNKTVAESAKTHGNPFKRAGEL